MYNSIEYVKFRSGIHIRKLFTKMREKWRKRRKICNPDPAYLRNAIRMFLTRLDAETITSMCDVDRIDLSTMVIK